MNKISDKVTPNILNTKIPHTTVFSTFLIILLHCKTLYNYISYCYSIVATIGYTLEFCVQTKNYYLIRKQETASDVSFEQYLKSACAQLCS